MKDFLNELASSQPAPGGGSASAMIGAVGASLVSMLMKLSLAKAPEEFKERFQTIDREANDLRTELEELVERDARSFELVMEAFKLPKATDEDKKERKEKIQAAFKEAANIPLLVMTKCFRVMELGLEGIKKGNPNAITDGGVAVLSGWTGLKGAALNVEINLGSIKDEGFALKTRMTVTTLRDKGNEILQEAETLLKEELNS